MRIERKVLVVLSLIGAWAAPAAALSVTPGRTQIQLTPGKTVEAIITATNDAQEKVHVSLSTKDWFILEANKARQLTVDRWLALPKKTEFDLKPGESRQVKIRVTCPPEAQGELVGMVSFLYQSEQPSMVTPIISVSVYLGAAGTEDVAGEIHDIAVNVWKDRIQGAAVIKSTGNVHVRPTGTFTFLNDQGETLREFPINEGNPAYPGREVACFAQMPADFKLGPGHYVARAHLEYRGKTWDSQRGFNVLKDNIVQMDPK